MGPILDMITVSHDVVDTSCEELGWCVNICLLCPFTALVNPPPPPLFLLGCNIVGL
jgi:hypothetical protein